jgi:hypothetical protein
MHYETRRSHWMQKHKLGVTCPNALFMGSAPIPLEHENIASMFHTPNALRDPQITANVKIQV